MQSPEVPDVRALLILSTGHLKRETAQKIEDSQDGSEGFDEVRHGYFGWAREDCYEDMPEEMVACCKYAKTVGASYIYFDRDGPQMSNLTWFDW